MASDPSETVATRPRAPRVVRFAGGEMIGDRYRLVRLLGRGGMGEVWEADHAALGRRVALKLVRLEAADARARLLHEAKILASLRHPSIVAVHDAGITAEGIAYLAMEVVAGESLAARLARGRIEVRAGVALVLDLLAGLEAAHASGVIHRDIKPDNVLLVPRGDGASPTLIDFGIAVAGGAAGDTAGTPQYMAPEQLRGEANDARTDVWGICMTLYEVVTGRAPFFADDLTATAQRVLDAALPYPTDVPGMDGRLWRVLTCGLRKAPADRFASVSELRAALVEWLGRSATARLMPAPPPAAPSAFEAAIREKLT
jgi:serine/threonine-protein kinase